MRSSSRTWRHHYVAQFYLRQWATAGGTLHEYTRHPRSGEVVGRTRYPKQTGFVRHLYSYESDGFIDPDPDDLERALGDEESKAAPVLEKMLADGMSGLMIEEKAAWAGFMQLQLDRDPERLRVLLELAEELREEVLARRPSGPAAERAAELFSVEMVRNDARGRILHDHPARTDWIKELTRWSWHSVRGPGYFITTDRPVLLNAMGAAQDEVAWTVAMALSPDVLLVCTPSSWVPESTKTGFTSRP